MGRPPAYIFVVRHGHRLDAADKQWHLTSPTPYDPPLTYGGWMHSRTVGARIASILQDEAAAGISLEPSLPSASASLSSAPFSAAAEPSRKPRRFRIILHSSPFLRCVQTSVAISAGLAANSTAPPALTKTQPDAAISTAASHQAHQAHQAHGVSHDPPRHVEKSILRLDAFLGEWLSPEYFEHITPPPKSALMLATAKAELLRRSSYHDYPHYHHVHSHARVHSTVSSHLWNNISSSNGASGVTQTHDPSGGLSGFDSLPRLANSLPGRDGDSSGHSNSNVGRRPSQETHHTPSYVFPVPSYALSTSEPIPRGYVAHARDACVSIDYQWDSSRDTLTWGDGGTLPEEWSSMHQRFRRGLRRLVDWYDVTEGAGEMVTRIAKTPQLSDPDCAIEDDDDDDEEEVEDVVVLVSHGAGCNALVGALTQQPVLADVAMSSLTMAKRRSAFDSQNTGLVKVKSVPYPDASGSAAKTPMAEIYELKLFANTDHLTSPSSPTARNRESSPAASSPRPFNAGYTSALREINFGSLYGSPSRGSQDRSTNVTPGSPRRSPVGPALVIAPSVYNANTGGITVGSGMSTFSVTRPDRSGSGTWGLWSPRQDEESQEKEPETPMFLDFSHEKAAGPKVMNVDTHKDERPTPVLDTDKPTYTTTADGRGRPHARDPDKPSEHHDEEHDKFDEGQVPRLRTSTGNGGLWGTPMPPGDAERLRDFSTSKRRWTVTER
ncbi:putative phosphoglycerate mutase [Rosellinia necatrix]|uniref:Putative phosphoglycerate mutase n=1 Tax=Rosellinia necatrix TaxID=77044 RepID=A0A1W2TLA8_ROSNE|nr:putative phosphoglycerate mutase [Rosellinia necatrix]